MSCNPAIGGLGKSQIVREIDVLGGQMAKAADDCAIHYRRLNASKGPAVRARRVQCDSSRYHESMLAVIESQEDLHLLEGTVERLITEEDRATGVRLTDGRHIEATVTVLTTGTFLRGKIHVGMESFAGGRLGDPPAIGLSRNLEELGLKLGRLKTGTPARLDASTVDTTRLEAQLPDPEYLSFSRSGPGSRLDQVDCWITRTNVETHRIIRGALSRSPLFSGVIRGRGPRYCPSIEDKVVRFPDRTGHQVILEPTDLSGKVFYPNGISTSLPKDVQEEMIKSIEGLEQANILEYGYAIEYDFVEPTQLLQTLALKEVRGLYLAGQINGTSGYEEAAGQGLLAGINAAFEVQGLEPVVLGRHESYIGVMIDDLVTRGTDEPYRMFSSRAEFRLMLREDNAAHRLSTWAEGIGLASGETLSAVREEGEQVDELIELLSNTLSVKDEKGRRPSLAKVLRRPEIRMSDLVDQLPRSFPSDVLEQVEVKVKYQGYIDRQLREASKMEALVKRKIPEGFDYEEVPGLSRELREKLSSIRPISFAQAVRVDGMTPAALMALSIWIKKKYGVPRETQP
jgi:tRNA uridine 5-carboxymethylaminomethyl modification enzyme